MASRNPVEGTGATCGTSVAKDRLGWLVAQRAAAKVAADKAAAAKSDALAKMAAIAAKKSV